MMVKKTQDGQYLITVSEYELITVSNCLNEVCHGIHIDAFHTRLGADKEEVREMLKTCGDMLRRSGR